MICFATCLLECIKRISSFPSPPPPPGPQVPLRHTATCWYGTLSCHESRPIMMTSEKNRNHTDEVTPISLTVCPLVCHRFKFIEFLLWDNDKAHKCYIQFIIIETLCEYRSQCYTFSLILCTALIPPLTQYHTLEPTRQEIRYFVIWWQRPWAPVVSWIQLYRPCDLLSW